MSTEPTDAHYKLWDALRVKSALQNAMHPTACDDAAQLLCDSEARAVEAALHGTSVDGLTLCGCKDHPHRTDLSCRKIRRADGTPLTISETFAALTAERERVRVLREALEFWQDIKSESAGLAGYHLNGDVCGWGELDDPTDAALATPANPPAATDEKEGSA